jgi:hypothetical protein
MKSMKVLVCHHSVDEVSKMGSMSLECPGKGSGGGVSLAPA